MDNLRSRAPVDAKVAADRQAARLKRDSADLERRRAKKEKELADEAAKAAEADAETKTTAPQPTEAERKAARDARYAARKRRQ